MTLRQALTRRIVIFLATTLVVGLIVFLLGWYTDLRLVAHAALVSVASLAFLPLVIIGIGLTLGLTLLAASMLAGLLGGCGDAAGLEIAEPFAEVGIAMIPGYYRWLARRKHPAFWGIGMGLLCGAAALWTVIATTIIPRELETTDAILDAQSRVEARFQRTSRYPAPSPEGHLTFDALGDGSRHGPLLDGFGRPLLYEKFGHWKVATYSLRSAGRDGVRGGKDDLCLHGGTKLGRFAQILNDVRQSSKASGTVTIRLGALRELRCPSDD
jgi:hypothetical protein